MENVETHLRNFRELEAGAAPELQRLRAAAIERFADVGFPTERLEDWKFTDVAPLAKMPFRLARRPDAPGDFVDAARIEGAIELVFVDGHYFPELSRIPALPGAVRVSDLETALRDDPGRVVTHLGSIARPESDAFTALNTAFLRQGAFVHVSKGVVLDAPIHLLFVASGGTDPVIVHPRVLIVAEESSEVSVVETYADAAAGPSCTNVVTEVAVGPNAAVTHVRLQKEGADAFHVATVAARQARDSRFFSHSVSIGASLARINVETLLDAPGASCTLDGLYLTDGRQHVDHHTSIDHRAPECTSRELYKGVLDGRSSAVFNGKVFVRPQAQKSDAGQVNKNLLLSRDAVVDTKPQLEIFADDVKCSHGATIGRLDTDALFFLRARGIGPDQARRVLIHAFANELVERVRHPAARAHLERAVGSRFQLDGAAT